MSGLVYSGARAEGTLLRLVPDNHGNIMGGAARLAPKNGVSVIQMPADAQQQQQQQQQQQMPPYDPARLKKHGKNGQPPPIAVAKRNARERNRVKQVNNGYATLRQHIPSYVAQGYGDRGKKLSKVETLRMALEYIRILQRLVAEADGLEYDVGRASGQLNDSPVMIPSPSGSAYSAGTHNGSGDLLNLNGSEIDEQHDSLGPDGESYELEDDDDDDRHFREDNTLRLSEKQNRELVCVNPAPRRRRLSPTYFAKQSSFGDEENIEPLSHRNNNNNNSNSNNNNLLGSYAPLVLQSTGSLIKRELEEERTEEEAYSGQMLIESPETGRLVGLKLEEHAETAAQLVYVAAASAEGLPAAYYKHELTEPASAEFMDVVSWWEQEQARLQPQHRSLAHV